MPRAADSPKVVVLTGVTRGLGRAMCERFIELGHTVLGCGRSVADVTGLRKRHPKPHDFTPLDISLEEQVSSWADRLLAEHGSPDLLINNAALINRNAPSGKSPPTSSAG